MENKFMAQWESFTKTAVESGKELETLNLKLAEKLVQKQMELISSAFEASNKFASMIGEAKGLPELIAEQTKFASEFSAKLMSASKEATEILAASRDDYRAWLEKGIKAFTEQTQTIVEAVTPKAPIRKAA